MLAAELARRMAPPKPPPPLPPKPAVALGDATIKVLEKDLARLTRKRVEQEREIKLSSKRKPFAAAVKVEEKFASSHLDEAALYKLFVKHGKDLYPATPRWSPAQMVKAAAGAPEVAVAMKFRDALKGPTLEGGLDKEEMIGLLDEIGVLGVANERERTSAAKQWLKELDLDGNGIVEWKELKKWWAKGGGRYKVKTRPVPEYVDRLASQSHWLSRARRPKSGGARTMRKPPALPMWRDELGSELPYAWYGVWGELGRPPSPKREEHTPRTPNSTAVERRVEAREKSLQRHIHGSSSGSLSARGAEAIARGGLVTPPRRPSSARAAVVPSPRAHRVAPQL